MSDASAPPDPRRGLQTSRMEAFSDGVFAIAITLLVLDLTVPAASSGDLLGALGSQWPAYLTYVVSFATIGSLWLAHSVITEYVDAADSVFLRLNLLLLMLVAILPFPTRLVGEFVGQDGAERVAVTVYGLNLLLAAAVTTLLWRYAVRHGLVAAHVSARSVAVLSRRLTPGVGFYVAMIAVGLFLPTLAVAGYLVIAVVLLVPVRRSRDERRSTASP